MKRYATIKTLRNTNENVGTLGTVYYRDVKYPEIPLSESDIYVLTDFGDRLDLLISFKISQMLNFHLMIS